MQLCLRCGKEIENDSLREKKFCSNLCRGRYNASQYYLKKKNDVDFKNKNKERFNEWYLENKEKHKIKMRVYMREYYRKHYSKAAKNEK